MPGSGRSTRSTSSRRVSGADSWQNFYVMVGGAAAALTGLILVAVSLHVRAILGHPLYRDRSFTSLQGLVTILVVAAAALTRQSPDALRIEVLALGLYWLARFARFIGFSRACSRATARPPVHSGSGSGCCGAPGW